MASLIRPREVARSVAPIELFFDLVYVFTVTQLSEHLFGDVSLRGMAQTLVLTLAVMYAWFMTVWTSNWLDVERRQVQLLLLGLMFAGLLMSTSVTAAFGVDFPPWLSDRAGLFVIGYLAIQIGRTAFAVVAFRGHRLHDHFSNALAWELATGLLWIVGIFFDGDARLAIWAVAVLATYAGVIAGHPLPGRRSPFSTDSQIYAEHLLERFRLFFLIALGETVLTVGSAFANYALIAMVIGIVAIAVGYERALIEPDFDVPTATAALIFGGPAVFLLAQLAFIRQATGEVSQSRIVACLALLVLAFATASISLLAAVIAASLVLLAVAVADTRAEKPSTATL